MFPDLTRDDVFRLETKRLWLRWPRAADVPAIVRFAGEKAVAEMTALIPHPLEAAAVEAFVLKARGDNADGTGLTMAVTPRSQPTNLVGLAGIVPDGEGRPHIGYWMAMPSWGQGLATEACRALIDAFFAYTPGAEIVSSARVVNPRSRRVLEKCGFAYVGQGLHPFPARGGVFPVDEFRLDRGAWRSLKSWRDSGLVFDRPDIAIEGAAPEMRAAPCLA